jgi:hypothetical protein
LFFWGAAVRPKAMATLQAGQRSLASRFLIEGKIQS